MNIDQIIQDIQSRKLSTQEVADKHGVSRSTITRLIRKENIGIGRGKRFVWNFTTMTPSLAYVMGAYITDGSIQRHYKSKQISQFIFTNTDKGMATTVYDMLIAEDIKATFSEHAPYGKKRKDFYKVSCYISDFAQWLYDSSQDKARIPDEIMQASPECQLAFICGTIDGDGTISKDLSILIRGIDLWLTELPTLLAKLDIKTTGLTVAHVLESGKIYYRVMINRQSFLRYKPQLHIEWKHERLYGEPEKRVRIQRIIECPCIICGKLKRGRPQSRCWECHTKNPELIQRLQGQASKAAIRANQIRWGTKSDE